MDSGGLDDSRGSEKGSKLSSGSAQRYAKRGDMSSKVYILQPAKHDAGRLGDDIERALTASRLNSESLVAPGVLKQAGMRLG